MDGSLLDMSADIIGETPKKKPMSPKSFAKDVVERLTIVTPSGSVDAAKFLSSNTYKNCYIYLQKLLILSLVCRKRTKNTATYIYKYNAVAKPKPFKVMVTVQYRCLR